MELGMLVGITRTSGGFVEVMFVFDVGGNVERHCGRE